MSPTTLTSRSRPVHSPRRVQLGFTLIELLVVISIIALLIGILLPALGAARAVARGVVCQSTMRQLALAQYTYTLDWDDWYAAPASAGAYVGLAGVNVTGGFNRGTVLDVTFDTTGTTPTSCVDWMSPSLGLAVELPANRARRTQTLFNDYGCAAAGQFNDFVWPGSSPSDFDQFDELIFRGGFKQISYLMPRSMGTLSWLWTRTSDEVPGYRIPGGFEFTDPVDSEAVVTHLSTPATTPRDFRPRLYQVGSRLSDKVMFADGTRYYTGEGALDFDPGIRPSFYGSFTSSTPFYDGSTTYGRVYDGGADGVPRQLPLTYRHPQNSINVAYFDGHVEGISALESYTNPNPWFPTGSVWVDDGSNTPESNEFMSEQAGPDGEAVIY